MLSTRLAVLGLLVLAASTSGQYLWEIGDQVMNVIEQPFAHAENVMLDTRVYEYEMEVSQDANLRQLQQMVARDDQRFLQHIVGPHRHVETTSTPAYEFRDRDGRLDSSYVLVEFSHNVDEDDLRQLLKYMSDETQIPLEAFSDLRVNEKAALFRVDQNACDPARLVDTILKHQVRIYQEKNLHVVNCDLAVKSHKLRLLKTPDDERLVSTPILVLLIVAPMVLSGLLGAVVCMVRRRRTQLLDDEEQLLKRNQSQSHERLDRIKNFRPSNWVRIIKRTRTDAGRGRDSSPTDEYQDLCRQRMESNTDKCSPISSTMCNNVSSLETPGLGAINSSTINSTPIRITNEVKTDSERNAS